MIRRLAIIYYIIAFAALQTHNAIPHHHYEVAQHHNDQGRDDHDDNDHHDNQHHDVEFGKSIVKPEVLKILSDQPVFTCGHFILLFDKLSAYYQVPPVHFTDHHSILYSIFLAHDIPLRAPPSFSIIGVA